MKRVTVSQVAEVVGALAGLLGVLLIIRREVYGPPPVHVVVHQPPAGALPGTPSTADVVAAAAVVHQAQLDANPQGTP